MFGILSLSKSLLFNNFSFFGMGSCIKTNLSKHKIFFSKSNKKSSLLCPPPCLVNKKDLVYTNIVLPELKTKEEVVKYFCSLKMNLILRAREKIPSLILQIISSNNLENKIICELAGEFLEIIYKEEKDIDNYNKSNIMKKIFEEYHLNFYKEYSSVIKGNVKTYFFLGDYVFAFKTLCEAVEIYQILLSHKKIVNKKKTNKKISDFWWMEISDNENSTNYTIIDTYKYLQRKFLSLSSSIFKHYSSIVADYDESVRVKIE